ncbi:MAG: NUDIX hydrolase [Spirochaetes bacterium]|nr:MAG: NUDIX hydrolase [Spirochaetota bacterium]
MPADFQKSLKRYQNNYPGEKPLVDLFRSLLNLPDAFYRTCRPGHFTASALILNPERTHLLLVEHRKLGIWVQPGGHADGEVHLEGVARREVEEETGVSEVKSAPGILDLDIHAIPARKDEGAHDHYDVRFLFTADPAHPLRISHEPTDLKWLPVKNLGDYTREESMFRMLRKAGALSSQAASTL